MKALALLPAFVLAACAASLPAPLPTGTPTAGFGQTARAGPLLVTPIALVEDSRCPMNARCIWAGRLTVRAEVRAGRTMDVRNVTLGVGQQIAEKPVNQIRIYLSLAIAVISLIAALVMLYAGIRNSVISIGRNPMGKKSIFRALVQVILTSILILIIGLFAVYLLLKL